jgi:choline monooxygenase
MIDYTHESAYRQLRQNVEAAATLIPDAYRSAEFFNVERERVWSRSWVAVAYTSQLPEIGDHLLAEVAGQPLLIIRGRDQKLRVFYNVCRHRGSRLIDQPGNCKVIRCPYHGWGYSLEGELLGTPYFKGLDVPPELAAKFQLTAGVAAEFCKDDYPLFSVATETWGGTIFVNLDSQPIPFSQWIGDLPRRFARHPLDQLELARRRTYEINANWKLIAENFMEYYHLPFGHPELCNVSGFDNHYRYQGPGMYTGMATIPLSNDPSTVSFEGLQPFDGLTATESQSAYFVMLFPNVAYWIFPHHLVTLLFWPVDQGRTIEHMDLLVHPDARRSTDADQVMDRVMNFWWFVNDQDVRLVERVQAGLQSKAYTGGRMCYQFEEPIHRFQNMVADLMTGERRIPLGDEREEAPELTSQHDGP